MVREVQQDLQKEGELERLAADGKKCNEGKKYKPVECYQYIFGTLASKERIILKKDG